MKSDGDPNGNDLTKPNGNRSHAVRHPYSLETARRAIRLLVASLQDRGVDQRLLEQAITEVDQALIQAATGEGSLFAEKAVRSEHSRSYQSPRNDYLGRALIASLDPFFPTDPETSRLILEIPVPGVVPRLVAAGVIDAIKRSQDLTSMVMAQHEKLLLNKAAMYRTNDDNQLDQVAFNNDPEVRMVVKLMLIGFSAYVEAIGEEASYSWLRESILLTPSFARMRRELVDAELSLIIERLSQKETDAVPATRSK